MTELLTTLVPLIVGSAVLPVQITITVLLLRSSSGVIVGAAWVAGMTAVRLVQGLVFGLVLETATSGAGDAGGPGPIVSTLLLVVGIAFLVGAGKALLDEPDEDAAPPGWMSSISAAPPGRAFAMGAGIVALSPKLWAFTLAAIGAIADAGLAGAMAVGWFLLFVVLAESVHLGLVGLTAVAPARAAPVLERTSAALVRYGREIKVGLGVVFGLWFLYKALAGFGII